MSRKGSEKEQCELQELHLLQDGDARPSGSWHCQLWCHLCALSTASAARAVPVLSGVMCG